jgi:cyclomaltodextrinase
MNINFKLALLFFLFVSFRTSAQEFSWDKNSAEVWSVNQVVSGMTELKLDHAWIGQNGIFSKVKIIEGKISQEVKLKEIQNHFVLALDPEGKKIISDTLKLELGFDPVPILLPELAQEDGANLWIEVKTLENPFAERLSYTVQPGDTNPEGLIISIDSQDRVRIEKPKADGNYFINFANASKFGEQTFKFMFRKVRDSFEVFGPSNEQHPWMQHAVLYQLTPSNFTDKRSFVSISKKIRELAELGINTLYLQPVFKTHRKGQGYDIVDYFSLKEEFGSDEELAALIKEAKAHGMKVLFDLVINHSSIHHPYAKNRIEYKGRSHYNDYYQTKHDGAKYSSHYTVDEFGFINYFWNDLVNLNYDNEEVQRWMLEACKHWVNTFDIDGYRFDAIWGVMARKPEFGLRLRNELKSIKPDILLLAEAKAMESEVYEFGYDAAYDWTSDTLWVSQWSWEYEYNTKESMTVFNHPKKAKRKELLEEAVFGNNDFPFRTLRFTENNDLHRFPSHHSSEQAKLASSLVFTLPGIPMLYQGQEVGNLTHPYTSKPVYDDEQPILDQDDSGMFEFYKKLIQLRVSNPALIVGKLDSFETSSDELFAFWRETEDQKLLVLMNLSSSEASFNLNLIFNEQMQADHYNSVKDLVSSRVFEARDKGPEIQIEPYQVFIFEFQ